MTQQFKIIPFDLSKARSESNPSDGLEVITRNGESARILCTDFESSEGKEYKLVVAVRYNEGEYLDTYTEDGRKHPDEESNNDLFLKQPVKSRRMTNRELSWWLQEHQEEHREYMFKNADWISSVFNYNIKNAEEEVPDFIIIRSNGGEWEDPLFPLFNEVEKIIKEGRKQFNVKDYISDIKTPVETRDGRAVKINKFPSPILTDYIEGFVEGNSDIITWNGKGKFSIIGEESEYDLFFKTLGKSNDKRN